jgi:hypothetical protein
MLPPRANAALAIASRPIVARGLPALLAVRVEVVCEEVEVALEEALLVSELAVEGPVEDVEEALEVLEEAAEGLLGTVVVVVMAAEGAEPEEPPQPASMATAASATRRKAIRLTGIGRSAYPRMLPERSGTAAESIHRTGQSRDRLRAYPASPQKQGLSRRTLRTRSRRGARRR